MRAVLRYCNLSWRMVRYRVAVMMWTFMLLGSAAQDGLSRLHVEYLWAAAALVAGYVSATTINDISDRRIDQVNLRGSYGRPLASGLASEGELYVMNAFAAGGALATSAAIGMQETLIVLMLIGLGYSYSLRPFLLSHHPLIAPLVLSAAYVVLPYWLGVSVAGGYLSGRDVPFLLCLCFFFAGRILLKDFRDKEGDRIFGKRTMLLRYGKNTTCFISMGAVAAGNILLLLALRPSASWLLIIQALVGAILYMLNRLRACEEGPSEQVAIGVAAKLGNGLLISLIALLMVRWRNTPFPDQTVLVAWLFSVYAVTFFALMSRRDNIVVGYPG